MRASDLGKTGANPRGTGSGPGAQGARRSHPTRRWAADEPRLCHTQDVPKMCLASSPKEGGAIALRNFSAHGSQSHWRFWRSERRDCMRSTRFGNCQNSARFSHGPLTAHRRRTPHRLLQPWRWTSKRTARQSRSSARRYFARAKIMAGNAFVPASIWDGGLSRGYTLSALPSNNFVLSCALSGKASM